MISEANDADNDVQSHQ